MLKHFKDSKDGIKKYVNYYLYGYYKEGTEKLQIPLTVDSLKRDFLEYRERKNNGDNNVFIEHKYYEELGLNDYDLSELLLKYIDVLISSV